MEIQLENVAKKFNTEWIFKNLNLSISHIDAIGISGPNGSGKSTLLQIIAGNLLQSKGKITYNLRGNIIESEHIFKHLSFISPAMSLPENFTLEEFISFHFRFKKLKEGYHNNDLPEIFKLENGI